MVNVNTDAKAAVIAPKVLVGCIVSQPLEFCIESFVQSLKEQNFKNFDLVFASAVSDETFLSNLRSASLSSDIMVEKPTDTSPAAVNEAMLTLNRKLRNKMLDEKYDYLLLTDIKTILPEGALLRMVAHEKDVLSANCLTGLNLGGQLEIAPALYDFAGDEEVRAMELHEVLNDGLREISCAGLGCILLSRKFMERIDFRFYSSKNTGINAALFVDARDSGFATYADMGLKCNQLLRSGSHKLNDLFSFDAYPSIRSPKVLVGCVTHDLDESYLQGFLESVRAQSYTNYDILFVDTSGNSEYLAKLKGLGAIAISSESEKDDPKMQRILDGRTKLRRYALDKGYDYLFFVDTDVVLPETALARLLSARKDLVAGVCLNNININGTSRVLPCLFNFNEKETYFSPMQLNDVMNNKLHEVAAGGLSCTLVTRNVLEKVGLRCFESSNAGEDIAFFVDVKSAGFRTFADNKVKCAHLVFPPGDPRNRKFLFETYQKGVSYSTGVKDQMSR